MCGALICACLCVYVLVYAYIHVYCKYVGAEPAPPYKAAQSNPESWPREKGLCTAAAEGVMADWGPPQTGRG